MISRKEGIVLANFLQMAMSAIDTNNPQLAKDYIRKIGEFVVAKTAPKPPSP